MVASLLSSNWGAFGRRTPTPGHSSNANTTEPGSEYALLAEIQ
jgi:hypothetical protein